jgi:hypothetical protein
MPHVYISYSIQDSDYAHKLASALQQRGFDVWPDRESELDVTLSQVGQRQIKTCACVILLVTPQALESDRVEGEHELARSLGKPIFPLLLEGEERVPVGCEPPVELTGGALPAAWFYDQLAQIARAQSYSYDGGLETFSPTAGEDKARKAASPQTTQMSAYYPRQVAPRVWRPLLAYVFRTPAARQVLLDAEAELGKDWAEYGQAVEEAQQQIAEGAPICATPYVEGFQFKPLNLTIGFYEDWERFDFQLRASGAPLDQFASGSITFTVEGVIVADVPLSIFVSEDVVGQEVESETTAIYDKVFCSYSHRDTQIVERVEAAYQALGMDYLRDVKTLKSGQQWDAQLLALIEQADIFQLFWSTTAAKSKFVRQEWEHALSLPDKPSNFLRPVFWEMPLPDPPAELGHIHFRYEPKLAEAQS